MSCLAGAGAERKRYHHAVVSSSTIFGLRIGPVEITPQSDEPLSQEDYLRHSPEARSRQVRRHRRARYRSQVFVDAEVRSLSKALTRVRYRAAARSIDPDRVDGFLSRCMNRAHRGITRLDSVAAVSCDIRTRMAEQIKARQVKLNWDESRSPISRSLAATSFRCAGEDEWCWRRLSARPRRDVPHPSEKTGLRVSCCGFVGTLHLGS